MTQYRLINDKFDAVQYNGQDLKDLPNWVRNFSGYSHDNGAVPVGRNLVGALLVPHPKGYYTAVNGDWLVLEGKQIVVYRPDQFAAKYEAIPVEPDAPVAQPAAPTPAPGSAADVPPVVTSTTDAPAPVTTSTTETPPDVEQSTTDVKA